MPCDSDIISANACLSEIGRVTDDLELLRLTAQNMAGQLVAIAPGTDVSPEALNTRACASGIGWEQSETNLLRMIAQNLCNQIT